MDETNLTVIKTIGLIYNAIRNTKNFEEAVHSGINIIIDKLGADGAAVWYCDEKDSKLHPYYWVCPKDITSKTYNIGEGIVGRVFKTNNPERMIAYKQGADKPTDEVFGDLKISSLVCSIVNITEHVRGCIQLFKYKGTFTSEEADTIDIMTSLIELTIKESPDLELPEQKGEVLVHVNNITKEFQNGPIRTKVLKGVHLDIYKGEFLVILGESGCGKSTLLNIISGLETATDGQFLFKGEDMTRASESQLTEFRRKNIGFIFQGYNLMDNLTAKQNLDFIGELVDNPMPSDKALAVVKLADKGSNYPGELSGGQQQRVSIARALIKNPTLIFADEPTAALDYSTSIDVLAVLEDVVATGTTLVMVTHNNEIAKMADRVVRIRDGQVYEITINRKKTHAKELIW